MSTIKSSSEHLTLNADGASKDIKFQANGVEKASISSAGAFTSTSIDATKLSGTVPNFTSTGIDDNATSIQQTLSNTEVGFGVTPKTWDSIQGFQLGNCGSMGSWSGNTVYNNNAYYAAGWKYITTNESTQINHNSAGDIIFNTAPSGTADAAISYTTAMTIKNDGTVSINPDGLGGSIPTAFQIASTSTNSLLDFQVNHASSFGAVKFRNGNGTVGSISMYASSVAYNTSSDYRLKENVVPMTGSIDRLKALKPSNFNFIADPDTTVDGFLAHEAQVVVPECVDGTKDAMRDEEYEVTPAVMDGETVVTEAVMGTRSVPDYQGIDQSKLVPLLVASLQEAIARIEQLENA